jgi:hypothetical protein
MNKKTTNALLMSKRLMAAGLMSGILLSGSFYGCSSGDGSPHLKESDEKTVYESTKGTVTEVEEVQPGNEYKIIDERIIDEKAKSIAIVHTLEGTTDTLLLSKIKSEKDSNSYSHRHSGLRGLLYYSLARSFFTNNLSNVTPDSKYYKNADAYNKSTGLKNNLQSSAASRTVRVPKASSRGYGSGKSFRSFGG